MKSATASILVIGNEILSGKIDELNASIMMKDLRELGVDVQTMVVIKDDEQRFCEELPKMMERSRYVFTSGGVGPTHDDITLSGIARALGRKLVRNQDFAESIRRGYGSLFREPLLKMADIPEGAELIYAGKLFVPVIKIENVYVFPGEPSIFRLKWEAIKESFRGEPYFIEVIYTHADEGEIADLLGCAERDHAGVLIGSYPRYNIPEYKVKVTIESKEQNVVSDAKNYILENAPSSVKFFTI
ncbi:MAG: molybdopterin-binding protein [Planctomycetes bacterium]|nr:molybdopterin-binding protein [Planctomycetota bacterium]